MDKSLSRYAELRVPRYTSYPTAPHFEPVDGDADWRAGLAGLDSAEPLSLYLHIPFCRKVCWYCACNMKLAARDEPVLAYAETLLAEIDLLAAALPARMKVSQVHWGGGTPTAMPFPALEKLMARLRDRFEVLDDAEIAFELDPRTFTPEMAVGLARLGTTRASLGVQEFDPLVQQTVNRIQPFETVKRAVDSLRAAGVSAINFDLMYGLPHQTVATIARSVDLTLQLRPDRIALFGYAHVPWMAKRQTQIPEAALPGAEARFEQAEIAAAALVRKGYERIGLDHFALPGDEMTRASREGTLKRNFQGYTVDPAPTLLGIGATSISALPNAYVHNISETGAWARAIESGHLPVAKQRQLNADDRLRRDVIERLMCDLNVDFAAIAARHGTSPARFLPDLDKLRPLVLEGFAEIDEWKVTVSEKGRPALRVIAAQFDAYLNASAAPVQRHAAAV